MSYGVGSQKMASALSDALKPRLGDAQLVSDFEALLVGGLPNGAPKGTELEFSTGGGKLAVRVNAKPVGAISSKPLAKAFRGIYCDARSVCDMVPVDTEEAAAVEKQSPGRRGFFGLKPDHFAIVGGCIGYGIGKLVC